MKIAVLVLIVDIDVYKDESPKDVIEMIRKEIDISISGRLISLEQQGDLLEIEE